MLLGKKYNSYKCLAPIAKIGAVFSILCFFLYFSYQVTHPVFPSNKNPIIFYSNQTGDDLKRIIIRAIENAQHSIFLQIYGLTDEAVINSLLKAKKRGILVKVLYDPSGSGALDKKIPGAIALIRQGLMHKKILIIDETTIFLGTANFTPTSLCMHDNVILGIQSERFAFDLQHSLKNHLQCTVDGQDLELWHLPDFEKQCLMSTLQKLEGAKSTIHIALFTFTHPLLLSALSEAKKRGVEVKVALDHSTAKGASRKAVEFLQKNEIPLYISKGGKLLHHKWCLIDQNTLLIGSANWTKSAFTINEDCLLVVHTLTDIQKKYFEKIWKNLQFNSIEEKAL